MCHGTITFFLQCILKPPNSFIIKTRIIFFSYSVQWCLLIEVIEAELTVAMLAFLKIAFGVPQDALEIKDRQANGTILPLSESAKQLESGFARNPMLLGGGGMNIPGLARTRECRSAATEITKGLSTQLALVLGTGSALLTTWCGQT